MLFWGLAGPLFARGPRWRRVNVGQATNPMQAVYAYDSLHIWASTYFGDVLFTKDGGLTWGSFQLNSCCTPLQGGIANSFFFFDSLNGWIAGEAYNGSAASFRLHTSDAGLSWTTQLDAGQLEGRQILFLNGRRGLVQLGPACNSRDSFMVTNDSGQTWQRRATGIPACYVSRFDFVDSLNGFASYHLLPSNTEGGLMRTRDGGNNWTVIPVSIPLCAGHKIAFLDTLNGWMCHCDPNVSNRYRFSRTHDGGVTWDSLFSFNGDCYFLTFAALDTAHFWLSGYRGLNACVQFSSDGGRNWVDQMPGVGDYIADFYALDSNHAYAVGNSGYVYIYSPTLIGDLNLDWSLSSADVVLMLNYTFLGIPASVPPADMDFNNDCLATSADVVLLLNRIFLGTSLQWGCAAP